MEPVWIRGRHAAGVSGHGELGRAAARIGTVLAPPLQKATLVATVQRSIAGIAPIPIRMTFATMRPAAQASPAEDAGAKGEQGRDGDRECGGEKPAEAEYDVRELRQVPQEISTRKGLSGRR
jgi:hypothetical protein